MDYLKIAQDKFAREAAQKFPEFLRNEIAELKKKRKATHDADIEQAGVSGGHSDFYGQWIHLGGKLEQAEHLLSVYLKMAGIKE